MKYRKRPIEIDAKQWLAFGDDADVVPLIEPHGSPCRECGGSMSDHGYIETREGGHVVCPGDWIVTGIAGERYPCKPSIFEATYDAI